MAGSKLLALACSTALLAVGMAEDACSGVADPPYSAPYCYSTDYLGEKVTVKINSLGQQLVPKDGQGTLDIIASGLVPIQCKGEKFTKVGQKLTGNWTDCIHVALPNLAVSYCSDQDTVLVEGKVLGADRKVTLKKEDCPSEVEVQAPTCTGAADPPSTTPYCYSGGELGEKVLLKVTSFQNEKGTVDVSGSGLEPISCTGKPFTKTGQTLSGDWSDCVKDPIKITSILYCSDQDQVLVNSQVGPVPAAVPLSKVACPSDVVVV